MLDTWFSRISLESTRPGNGRRRQGRASGVGISEMSIYFTEGSSNQWSEAGERLGNLQKLMLERRKRTKDT